MAARDDLAARAAIAHVLALYCHALDRRQFALLADCFHADATYRFGPIDGSWRDFVESARRVLVPLRRSHHALGQTLFRIAGDRAIVETYLTAFHRVPADAPADAAFPGTGEEQDVIVAGRYLDRFERRERIWRIARREGIVDWRRAAAAADGGLLAAAGNGAGPAPADPAGETSFEHDVRTMA